MTNLFRSLVVWWRRRRLQAAPPPCPMQPCDGPVILMDNQNDVIPRWYCRGCETVWWQDPKKDKKPLAYGRWNKETWEKIINPPKP